MKEITINKENNSLNIKEPKKGPTIEEVTGHSAAELSLIKSHIVKNVNISEAEVVFACMKSKALGLSILTGELWFYKDGKGNLLSFAGKDGFYKLAHKNKFFNGIRSCEVRKNDHFKPDFANSNIDHTWDISKDRGEIIGAWAIAFRTDGEPTIEWADIATYKKGYKTRDGKDAKIPWNTHTAEMIKKVAEVHAIKKAFGIVGLYHESEFGGEPDKFFGNEKDKPKKNLQDRFADRKKELEKK
jgi:hypothetical protein